MLTSPASALCPLLSGLHSSLADRLAGMDWLEHLWEGGRWESFWGSAGSGRTWLTLDLRLIHNEVTGCPAALKLLRAALLGTELFVLSLVEGKSRSGEATVAGGARKGCQWVLLGMKQERKRKKVTKSLDSPDSGCRTGFVFQSSPSPSLSPAQGSPSFSNKILPYLRTSCTIIFSSFFEV